MYVTLEEQTYKRIRLRFLVFYKLYLIFNYISYSNEITNF